MSAAKHRARAAKARSIIIPAMAARWPKAFAVDERRRKPLKLGIARDLFAASARGLASALPFADLNQESRTTMTPNHKKMVTHASSFACVTKDDANAKYTRESSSARSP